MHRIAVRVTGLLATIILAGCASRGQDPETFRSPGTGIYSNAVLQNDRLVGQWVQVAGFSEPGAGECTAGMLDVKSASPTQLSMSANLCLGGGKVEFAGDATVSGPGRFLLSEAGPNAISEEWWILWVDDGYRTLVVGTPSGSFGMILNRDADLPKDRMQAAQEILTWNGYDLTRLRTIGPG